MGQGQDAVIRELAQQEYKWGFVTDIEEERIPKGLNEDIVRLMQDQSMTDRDPAQIGNDGLVDDLPIARPYGGKVNIGLN